MIEHQTRQALQALQQGLGIRAAMQFHMADDDVHATARTSARGAEHRVGLADAGRGAEENLQAPLRFAYRLLLQPG